MGIRDKTQLSHSQRPEVVRRQTMEKLGADLTVLRCHIVTLYKQHRLNNYPRTEDVSISLENLWFLVKWDSTTVKSTLENDQGPQLSLKCQHMAKWAADVGVWLRSTLNENHGSLNRISSNGRALHLQKERLVNTKWEITRVQWPIQN